MVASGASLPFGPRTRAQGCVSTDGQPDHACTPGAIIPTATAGQICQRGYSASVRNVSPELKREIYASYGIKGRARGAYEVDHLVSLELGGANDVANLWPEPAEPKPGFHEKDIVENYLHDQLCRGARTLPDVQRAIAQEWAKIYDGLTPAERERFRPRS